EISAWSVGSEMGISHRIVISHNAKEISEICNRLVFLKNGKIFNEIKKSKSITENSIKKVFKKMEEQ
ncbi:MAG: hypothetical protein K2J69_00630, partial [Malacoplasma sp.]|nr:hypothetical protein [Malacoplasma sp.]